MDSIWSKLRHHSKPSDNFRENLRADLFEKMTKKDKSFFVEYIEKVHIPESKLVLKIERDWSMSVLLSDLKTTIFQFFKNTNRTFLKGMAFLGTGIAATLFILPLFSVVSVSKSLALEPSVLRTLSGDVDILRSSEVFDPIEYQELYTSDIVTTGEGAGAEIVFFDGSILRLAENTEVKIVTINPHSLLFSTGQIEVVLLHGNVWLKTFKDSSLSEKEAFHLYTPSFTILPNRATLSVHYKEGKEWVYALENSATITINAINVANTILLKKAEMLQFSIFDTFSPLNEVIPGSFYDSKWVENNLSKDLSYTKEYMDRVSEKMQERYIMSALSSQVEEFLDSDPTDEELSLFLNDINSLLLVLDSAHTKEDILAEDIAETPEPSVTPAIVRYRRPVVYREEKTKNNNTSSVETFSIEGDSLPLEEKEENIVNTNTEKENNTDELGEKVQKRTAQQIAEERRAIQKEVKINAAVNSFSQQIDAFEFENSRKTTALNILDKIPESEESIELLRRIEMDSPNDVKEIVKERRKKLEENFLEKSIEDDAVLHMSAEEIDITTIEPIDTENN